MKLGINGWRLQGKRTGVGRYLENLVTRWSPEVVGGRFDEINFYTPAPLTGVSLPAGIRERVVGPEWKMLIWENLRFSRAAGEDVLFCPSYSRPLLAGGKVVLTPHDATLKLYPELASFSERTFYNRLYGWSAQHADLIITSTEAARDDICRAWAVRPDKIRVVGLGIATIFRPLGNQARPEDVAMRFLGTPVPYFLFVGKMTGRRNIPTLFRAFAEFKRRTASPHKLLVVGIKLERLGLDDLLAELEMTGEICQSGYVSDEDLNLIYNAAQAFVMPSTYENGSLPVMESQAVGTPVITVDTTGTREATGGAALMISRLDVTELAEAMARVAADPALRRELSETGLRNAERYSWDKCATETLGVLEEAVRAPRATPAPRPGLSASPRR